MWTILSFTLGIVGSLLNRLRGGWFKSLTAGEHWWNGSIACKLLWAIPTGILLFVLTTPDTNMWYRIVLLVLSSYCAWAFWGSGAHSIMSKYLWVRLWETGGKAEITENYSFWLPWVIDPPTRDSPEEDFWVYHMTGKSVEGIVRMATTVLPICILAPEESLWVVLSGVVWGPLFWASWQFSDTDGWKIGEILTGWWTWFIIGFVFLVY